jgi:hypothetical protein
MSPDGDPNMSFKSAILLGMANAVVQLRIGARIAKHPLTGNPLLNA